MHTNNTLILAALVFAYALFEFLAVRIIWGRGQKEGERGRRAIKKGLLLFAMLMMGTVAVINTALVVGGVGFAFLYALQAMFTSKRERGDVKRELEKFLLKQIVAALLLIVVWRVAGPFTPHEWFVNAEALVFSGMPGLHRWLQEQAVTILSVGIGYLFAIGGGTGIVRGILAKFPLLSQRAMASLRSGTVESGTSEEESAGEWIGILERIITLTFVLTNSYTAIAFALTAKSIARFKELENKDFAEYYLLGTSASIATALLAGIVVKMLLTP